MKKICMFFSLMMATCLSSLSANCDTDCSTPWEPSYDNNCFDRFCNWNCNYGMELKFRAAYFYPIEGLFREIYTRNLCEYQLELSKDIVGPTTAWVNVGWFTKSGRSIGLNDKTRISLVPVSFGFNYKFCLTDCMNVYLGAGVSYVNVRIHDDSDFVHRHTNKGSWGGVIKTGIQYFFTQSLFGDVFADYQYNKLNVSGFNRHDAQVGGYKIGAGIGVRF